MLQLGFSLEELMFPENYHTELLFHIESNCSIETFSKVSPKYEYPESTTIDDDDDLFTIKQLNPNLSLNGNSNITLTNDQTLPMFDFISDNGYFGQIKSFVEIDGSITTFLLPNLSHQVIHDNKNASLLLENVPLTSTSSLSEERLLTTNTSNIKKEQQQSNKYTMPKSTSSLSFCTQSSTSMTSSSTDEMSSNSNDVNELTIIHHCTDSSQRLSHHYKHDRSISDDTLNVSNRRRRKRTIFSAADIEHLREAFIQNPKPNQQDIALLSEQLGHDSYVIRVWFYNKRQASKKTDHTKYY